MNNSRYDAQDEIERALKVARHGEQSSYGLTFDPATGELRTVGDHEDEDRLPATQMAREGFFLSFEDAVAQARCWEQNRRGCAKITVRLRNHFCRSHHGAEIWRLRIMACRRGKTMSRRVLFIAAYDIASPKRLRQVHRTVRKYARGGQKSVFECYLTPLERRTLLVRVRSLISEKEDRFALLRVEERTKPMLLGTATPVDPDFHYVG